MTYIPSQPRHEKFSISLSIGEVEHVSEALNNSHVNHREPDMRGLHVQHPVRMEPSRLAGDLAAVPDCPDYFLRIPKPAGRRP